MKKGTQSKKMWSGRFKTATHPAVERFTASLPFDRRLYAYDIAGSVAWARALARAKVIPAKDRDRIIKGLLSVLKSIQDGRARFLPRDEDIHMAVERMLTERIGPVGGKLHTGRSRNDQVALDLRLYLREETRAVLAGIRRLRSALLRQAGQNRETVMPGYTHLQRAQPVLLPHHLLAYVEMLDRDRDRFSEALTRINVLPIGSGALAGTNYPVSRERIARELEFSGVTRNSLDAVGDRDFVADFLSAASLLMMHLSRLAEELILWSTAEFGFAELPDAFCTGSSLMPQKKNPDVLELVRGKTGRVYGHLLGLLTTLKALPLAYNRDLQEDKEPLFDTVDTARDSLSVLSELLAAVRFRKAAMRQAASDGFLLATDLADYLVLRSVPFRNAHETAGRIVRYCLDTGKDLSALSLKEFRQFSPLFEKDITNFLTVARSLERKGQTGATAPAQVLRQIQRAGRNGTKG
jgi:argininosuccinate lyase